MWGYTYDMDFLTPDIIDILIKVLVAMLLGMVIGTERIIAHKTAGMRTYALVAVGSTMFIIISESIGTMYSPASFVATQIAAAVITGVGFLGTGIIFKNNSHLVGLTSATGIWVAAGIGIAVGYGFYPIAIIATFATLFIFTALWFIEQQIKKIPPVAENREE